LKADTDSALEPDIDLLLLCDWLRFALVDSALEPDMERDLDCDWLFSALPDSSWLAESERDTLRDTPTPDMLWLLDFDKLCSSDLDKLPLCERCADADSSCDADCERDFDSLCDCDLLLLIERDALRLNATDCDAGFSVGEA